MSYSGTSQQLSILKNTAVVYLFIILLIAPSLSSGQATSATVDASALIEDIRFYNPITGRLINMGEITEKTVTDFELLYATPGTGDISEVAGHLMLRIKLNNKPQAESNQEENLNDENLNDIVISFLADTREFQPSGSAESNPTKQCKKNWFNLVGGNQDDLNPMHSITQSLKGLSGGLDTRMEVQSLAYTLKVYTIEEDRNLLRYKLKLSPQQRINLLKHLSYLKHHHKADYYFFSQNCASILVSVLGKGIGSEEIERFHPIVSAPNSLVALLVRKGLAEPVTPGFYSYRKKGYLAKNIFKQKLAALKKAHPDVKWPANSALDSTRTSKRRKAIKNIAQVYQDNPRLYQQTYELATWAQEAELAYSHKDLVCELYTSHVSADARIFQQQLLKNSSNNPSENPIKSIKKDHELDSLGAYLERQDYSSGIPHTKVLSYSLGLTEQHHRKKTTENTTQNKTYSLLFNGALFRQEMGSPSSLAMQRTSRVTLGQASFKLDDEENNFSLENLDVLKLSKFRDQLGRTQGFWHGSSAIGFGLSLLNIDYIEEQKMMDSRIAGAELLFGLLSSEFNKHYLYAAGGINWDWQKLPTVGKDNYDTNTGVRPIAGLYSLITLQKKRRLQIRSQLEFSPSVGQELSSTLRASAKLDYRLGNFQKHLILLNIFAHYQRQEFNSSAHADFTEKEFGISFEWNHL
jgi:hypothetical protein